VIPLPDDLIAWTAPPEHGYVLVVSLSGELRLPAEALPGRRGDVLVGPADEVGDIGTAGPVVAPEQVLHEAGEAPAATELADWLFGEDAGAADGHDETVPEQMFDPFDGDPEPPFEGRELVDVDTGGRV
jgi:hypothetical protein